MVELLRHRQTKEAATDTLSLTPPRHIPTLRFWVVSGGQVVTAALERPDQRCPVMAVVAERNGGIDDEIERARDLTADDGGPGAMPDRPGRAFAVA